MSKIVSTIAGDFDQARVRRLRRAYDQCVKKQKSEFYFENNVLLISFAKYLLEFLEPQFK